MVAILIFPLLCEGLKSVTNSRVDRDRSVRVQFNAWIVREIIHHKAWTDVNGWRHVKGFRRVNFFLPIQEFIYRDLKCTCTKFRSVLVLFLTYTKRETGKHSQKTSTPSLRFHLQNQFFVSFFPEIRQRDMNRNTMFYIK